ncbi:hypothetical protein R6Q57_012907 [Mikania cordata]
MAGEIDGSEKVRGRASNKRSLKGSSQDMARFPMIGNPQLLERDQNCIKMKNLKTAVNIAKYDKSLPTSAKTRYGV